MGVRKISLNKLSYFFVVQTIGKEIKINIMETHFLQACGRFQM